MTRTGDRVRMVLSSFLLAGMLLTATPSAAQDIDGPIPRNEEAASIFEQGVEAFRAGDYGMAYRRFRLATDSHEFNRTTTAALIMAVKSLYRDGRFEQAAALADEFVRRYPTSRYRQEAEQVRSFAREHLQAQAARRPVMNLGVALPLTGSGAVAQSMFNGIRIAVDAHNRVSGDEMPVRMIFRDTHGDPSTAREVVAELEREGVHAIIGPIFSDEARAAAREAERRQIVLVAPLATDEDVAEGRRFVFQANPPITTRGRVMARYAMREEEGPFGIVARLGDSIAERMAEGFQDEVLQRGGEVSFYQLLDSAGDWARLASAIGPDTLGRTPALYLALAGSGSRSSAEAALRGLVEDGNMPNIYGGDGWHDLSDGSIASRFKTTYATDFYLDPGSAGVRDFERAFTALAGQAPDRPAFTGYDVTTFLLTRRLAQPGESLEQTMHNDASYQGLGVRIDFGRSNINEALYVFGYRDGRLSLLR